METGHPLIACHMEGMVEDHPLQETTTEVHPLLMMTDMAALTIEGVTEVDTEAEARGGGEAEEEEVKICLF
jgi:hypothetical protein